MRIALVVTLLLTAVLIMVSFAAADPRANELGRVMILEYHKIDYPEERWTRTPENFRRDLEALYARGYRLQSLNDLLDGKITVGAGFTPVVLTFDDSSPGQFRYALANTIAPQESARLYERYVIPAPGTWAWPALEGGALEVGGSEDNLVEPAPGTVVLGGRCHLSILQEGWEQVADDVLDWALSVPARTVAGFRP